MNENAHAANYNSGSFLRFVIWLLHFLRSYGSLCLSFYMFYYWFSLPSFYQFVIVIIPASRNSHTKNTANKFINFVNIK